MKKTFSGMFRNRKSTEIMENQKFDCGRKNFYIQTFSNI